MPRDDGMKIGTMSMDGPTKKDVTSRDDGWKTDAAPKDAAKKDDKLPGPRFPTGSPQTGVCDTQPFALPQTVSYLRFFRAA
jgi:hypothetical protein